MAGQLTEGWTESVWGQVETWWKDFENRFIEDESRRRTTERMRIVLAQIVGALLPDIPQAKLEIWIRSEFRATADPRHLELWCSSQFQYMHGRPSWPKTVRFGEDDLTTIIKAFGTRYPALGEHGTGSRWTQSLAVPIVLEDSPYDRVPVGVISLSVLLDDDLQQQALKDDLESVSEALQELGVELLLPTPPAPRP